jgi:uncharacterized protein YggE
VERKITGGTKVKKLWLTMVGMVLLVGVLALAGCGSEGATNGNVNVNLNSQQQGIWVNGEGKVTVVPDTAIITLGIQAQSSSVAQAQSDAAAAMDKVMTALKDQGVAEKDIQTQYYNIQRMTRWDNDKQEEITTGYQVTNTVTAKIRKVENAGAVVDAVAAAGGDFTRINSIGFTVDDPKPYQEQARELAVADAAAKAKKLADVADVKLGKPNYISENSYVPSPIYRADVAKAESAQGVVTPISAGEMEITTNVQIAYDIAK